MIGRRQGMLVLLLVSIASGSASAQSWEMSGFAGFTPAVGLERRAPELTDLDLRGGFTFSFQAARFVTPHWSVEAVFSQQASALEAGTPDGSAELYGITLVRLHANLVYVFGADGARLRPFVFGGGGATHFSARDLESATKASFGLGGGVRYFPWAPIGLRAQLHYKPAWLNDDPESNLCEPFGFCQAWLQPIEITAGVIIRF
jgi:hypothetical protein